MRNLVLAIIIISTPALILACGKKDEKDGGGNGDSPGAPLTAFEQITGNWNGIYVAISDGKPFGEWQPISASFRADGVFNLTLDNDSAATVTGKWTQFQGTSMIWTISDSTISPIGTRHQVVQPNYALEGRGLRISADKFEIKLPGKREGGGTQGGSQPVTLGVGAWNCALSARQSKVVVSDNHEFSLSSINRGERAFVARGVASLNTDTAMTLTPRYVSDSIPEGSYFELRVTDGETNLLFIKNEGETSLGKCWK